MLGRWLVDAKQFERRNYPRLVASGLMLTSINPPCRFHDYSSVWLVAAPVSGLQLVAAFEYPFMLPACEWLARGT